MKKLIIVPFILLVLTSPLKSQNNFMYTEKNDSTDQQFVEFVPEWAKNVVWYQIFPDRFRNGDPDNDPTLESIEGAYPHDVTSPWQIHPWTSDWYELQPYEKKNGEDIWFNLQRRRYGGDLQGIIDKLDYLEELGIGAIYLNPVFWSPSLHKYDAATYHHIDPYFGPDPDADIKMIETETHDNPATWVWTSADKLFLNLINEVHKRNMKIIIDGVFNHMGLNSWAFKDVVNNQQKSNYKEWFKIKSWDDEMKGTNFVYDGWYGVKELPEFNQDENGIVDGPKKYIFDITKRWMDPDNDGKPSDGIDGWRLDVAFMIKHNFWKEWRKYVKQINPRAYLTAEIVDSIGVVKPYLQGDEFDAVMNYNFLFITAEYFIDDTSGMLSSEFDNKLRELREAFPPGVSYVQQNLFGSHDTQRFTSHIVNRDKFKIRDWGKTFNLTKGSNPNYDTRKPTKEELDLMKLMLIFQMTYVGAPYIYYGDEVGMWGANDPDCRKPMVWPENNYEPEKYLPDQSKKRMADSVLFYKDLFEFYKNIIHIRNKYEELQVGNYKVKLIDDKAEIYVYSRRLERNGFTKEVIVAINKGKEKQLVSLNTDHNEYYSDLLNHNRRAKVSSGKIVFIVKPMEGRILLRDYYKK
ncbi:MAG: glycoside hydrolase family 13 protein [Ignavibacteria bacterium]|nr:glycoside hydrolase family 13 protein [Ignavibacteria bacterium]